jgi:hypothetical protein
MTTGELAGICGSYAMTEAWRQREMSRNATIGIWTGADNHKSLPHQVTVPGRKTLFDWGDSGYRY